MIKDIKVINGWVDIKDSRGNSVYTTKNPNLLNLSISGDHPTMYDLCIFLNKMYEIIQMPIPKNVIFNDPATIVYWDDGTKTVVKCGEDDIYDKEKGLALCYMKKCYDNKGNYNDILKKWCEEKEEPKKEVPHWLPHWIKGKDFIKCSNCGFDALFPVTKCPGCESVMDCSNLMMDGD